MKEMAFLEGINGIDPNLLEETPPVRKASGRKALKWVALAAALLALLGGATVYALSNRVTMVSVQMPGGESGFRAEAELPLVKWKEFKGEIRGAGEEIIRQYAEYVPEPPASSHLTLPNLYNKGFDSLEEAMEYIGLESLKTPTFPYDTYHCGVAVFGNEKGVVNRVDLILQHIEANSMTAQERVTVLTEAAEDANLVSGGVWTQEWPRDVEFQTYVTPGGNECRIALLRPQYESRYMGLTGYIAVGKGFYEMNLGSVEIQKMDEAIGILHAWADALD